MMVSNQDTNRIGESEVKGQGQCDYDLNWGYFKLKTSYSVFINYKDVGIRKEIIFQSYNTHFLIIYL